MGFIKWSKLSLFIGGAFLVYIFESLYRGDIFSVLLYSAFFILNTSIGWKNLEEKKK